MKKKLDPLNKVCTIHDHHVTDLNFSVNYTNSSTFNWHGTVHQTSVYSLHLMNCDSNRSVFSVNAYFMNPGSYLDSRDEILLHLYLVFALVYFVISMVWWINAAIFTNFRVPLHTMFLLLPMIRCVILMLTSSNWGDVRLYDQENATKTNLMFILNFIYYTLMFTGIASASAGFCTYRTKFHWKDSAEIILSSFFLALGMQLVPLISDIQQAFFIMAILIFSILWYLKQSIVSMIIVTQLMQQMKDERVVAKIKLAHCFAISSFITIVATTVISIYAAAVDSRKFVCSSFLEIGLIVSSILQLKFFLFRKEYYGEPQSDSSYTIKIVKPKTLVEPNKTQVALLIQEIKVRC